MTVVVALRTSRRDGNQKLSDSLLERVSFEEASGALSGFGTGAFRCRDVHRADRESSTVFLKTYVAEDPASSKLLAWCFVRSGANRIGAYRARSSIRKRPRSPSMCRPPTVEREGGFPVIELHGLEGLGSGFVASSVFEKGSRSIDFGELGFEGGSSERILVRSRIRGSDLGS